MTAQDNQAQFIDIDDLRVGMFIYLDLGWMKHPFALNSFKISSHGQIDTLRELNVTRLRWSPEKSDLEPLAEANASPQSPTPGTEAAAARQALAEAVAAEAAAAAEVRRRRLERLKGQHEGLELCERQFSAAARTYHQIAEVVRAQPEVARTQISEMVGSMIGKLYEQGESAIRLLSENMGERASMHSLNVTVISLLLGKSMGLDAAALEALGTGALLHDIGKIELPDRLRWQDRKFNAAERKLYQEHVAHGLVLGQAMKLPVDALAIIAQHHELSDGRGYPRQLPGDRISPLARVVALVNHYDQLCNPANPAEAATPHEALSLIFAQMKRQFDAGILSSFIRMMGVYPPGSVVELTDGRFALVISVNSARPLKPQIVIYEPHIPRDEALIEDLELNPVLNIRRSIKPLQLSKTAFDYLSPRKRICYFFERARSAQSDEGAP